MRHIIPISGKDSLATALLQTARHPELNYEYMFNPTGMELPEVFDWIKKVEKHLGKPIHLVGRSLKQIIVEQNWFLPSRLARYCTRMSKIEPMEKFIGKKEATIYYGIRADEDRGGYDNSSTPNITPRYPLQEMGINLPMVYAINHKAGLKPPTFFWQKLWDAVTKEITTEYIHKHFTEWHIDSLFAWRSRTNCANCFNQRLSEWVGLLEHHPELFWEYESWEHNVSEFYFAGQNKPLRWVADNADAIFKRLVRRKINEIKATMQRDLIYEEVEDDKDFIDMLPITSCGLYCGK